MCNRLLGIYMEQLFLKPIADQVVNIYYYFSLISDQCHYLKETS